MTGTTAGGGNWTSIIILVVLFAVMYFLMIRPERKKKKQLEEMRSNIVVGDTITTIGGIIGKVVYVSNDFLVIETSEDRVRIQFAKWAVSTVGKAKEDPDSK